MPDSGGKGFSALHDDRLQQQEVRYRCRNRPRDLGCDWVSRGQPSGVPARKGDVWNIRPLCAFAHHCDLRCSIFERRT
jgi:hypothetical protein